MSLNDFVRVKGDSYVYQIVGFVDNKAVVEDGHCRQYVVELSKLQNHFNC